MMAEELKTLGEVGAPPLVLSHSRPSSSSSTSRCLSRDGRFSRQSSSGSFEVLPVGDSASEVAVRVNRSRPDSGVSSSSLKQVALPSVPRKNESECFIVTGYASSSAANSFQKSYTQTRKQSHDSNQTSRQADILKPMNDLHLLDGGEPNTDHSGDAPIVNGGPAEDDDEEDPDESSSDDDDDDDAPVKAPNELIMEFLHYVMNEEYQNAEKLCKLILVYEPNNSEANTFLPLIKEKLQLDAEDSGSEESDSDSGTDDDDDDDDDEDDTDSDSGNDSENSDDDDESGSSDDPDEDKDGATVAAVSQK